MDKIKLTICKATPWWVLRFLWKSKIVGRETVFRWETNVALGEWAVVAPYTFECGESDTESPMDTHTGRIKVSALDTVISPRSMAGHPFTECGYDT